MIRGKRKRIRCLWLTFTLNVQAPNPVMASNATEQKECLLTMNMIVVHVESI